MSKQLKNISKVLSLVLRHEPEYIGIEVNEQGWVNVNDLIEKLNQKGIVADKATIQEVVATNDKKRFAFNEDKTMIRASQGHSIDVVLDFEQATPPDALYHGTPTHLLNIILKEGLKRRQRHHVHLSVDIPTALAVGSRHGKPVILEVDTKAMLAAGHLFYLSQNGVWLIESVEPVFLRQVSIP